jgi:hypothetical protein
LVTCWLIILFHHYFETLKNYFGCRPFSKLIWKKKRHKEKWKEYQFLPEFFHIFTISTKNKEWTGHYEYI